MGIFDRFKNGLQKTRDFIADSLHKMGLGMGRFDEEQLDDLEMILIQADLGARSTDEVMGIVREEIRQTHDDSGEHVLAVLKRELLNILGPARHLELKDNQLNIILLVGVNGTGKTTTAGKLCLRFKQAGKTVLLAAADTFRAAAIEQLTAWGERTDTAVIRHEQGADPASVVYDAVAAAKSQHMDVLIIDTAGRLHNKKNLMDELNKIRRVISREAPEANLETLLVLDATTGQNAVVQTQAFTEVADVTGLVISKLDGNSKGGIAVAVAAESHKPIYLAGLGEDVEDLVDFDPVYFVDSLLPDEETLAEDA